MDTLISNLYIIAQFEDKSIKAVGVICQALQDGSQACVSGDGTNLALWTTSQGRRETTVVPRPAEAGVRVRD